MIEGKKVIGIIPARGGSKGIPNKNIKLLLGIPLIGWTIKEAQKSKYIDRLILSSDNQEIILVAKKYGLEVPFVRPSKLAKDTTSSMGVIIHALQECSEFDIIVLLQPTSPMRKVEDIDGAIQKMVDLDAPACVSVTLPDKSPYWMFKMDHQERLLSLFHKIIIAKNRQDLPIVYALNGAIYIARVNWIKTNKTFIKSETIGYPMPRLRSFDIDDENDFFIVEKLI